MLPPLASAQPASVARRGSNQRLVRRNSDSSLGPPPRSAPAGPDKIAAPLQRTQSSPRTGAGPGSGRGPIRSQSGGALMATPADAFNQAENIHPLGNIPEDDLFEENMRLKQEIRNLQSSIVQNMRGGNKFIGGGQFKGGVDRTVEKKCSDCGVFRTAMQKHRAEANDLKHYVAQLQDEIQAWQEDHLENQTDVNALSTKYQQDVEDLKKLLTSEREAVTKLTEENEIIKRELDDALVTSQGQLAERDCQLEEADERRRELEGQLDGLREKVGSMATDLAFKASAAEKHELEMAQKESDARELREEVKRLTKEILDKEKVSESEIECLKARVQELELETKDAGGYKSRIEELERANRLLEEELERLRRQLADERAELLKKSTERDDMKAKLEETKRDALRDVRDARGDLSECKAELEQFRNSEKILREEVIVLKEEIIVLKSSDSQRRSLEQEIDSLRKEVSDKDSEMAQMKEQIEGLREVSTELREQYGVEENLRKTAEEELAAEKKRREDAVSQCSRVQDELEQAQGLIRDLQKELDRLMSEAEKVESGLGEKMHSLEAERNDLVAKLKALEQRIKDLEAENSKLKTECSVVGRSCEQLGKNNMQLKSELESANEKVKDLDKAKSDIKWYQDQEAEMLKKLRNYQNRANALQAENQAFKKDLGESEAINKSLLDKANTALQRLKQQSLDTTLQSLVRLCVVAPTVNVSFGTQILKYKATLPRERITAVLEAQVLPHFAKLFVQMEEGLGPDGGSLDNWLDGLIDEMKGAIESHLMKVFKE